MAPDERLCVIACDSWSDFAHDRVLHYLRDAQMGNLVFRGHSNSEWPLESSLVRFLRDAKGAFLLDDLEDAASWSISEFRRGLLSAGVNPALVEDGLAIQALAQHYGLPTTLLDWSMSPLTAAYFAYAGLVGKQEDVPHIAVWMLDTTDKRVRRIDRREDNTPIQARGQLGQLIWFRPGAYGNDRLRNQFGSFTLLRSELPSIESFLRHSVPANGRLPLVKFLLPSSDADAALHELAFMGFDDDRLFPGVDQLAIRTTVRLRDRLQTVDA